MTAVSLQNPDLLRRLSDAANPPATLAALASEMDRDPANLRKTLKRLEGEGTVQGFGLTDLGLRVMQGLDIAEGRAEAGAAAVARPGDLIELHPARLRPDPDQPRKRFDPAKLEDLAQSIADKGLLLPILARPATPVGPEDDAYPAEAHVIIAGERRWRACMKIVSAGEWPQERTITVRIATPEDEADAFETAVVENMQRDDLNHMEMGEAFERMAQGGKSNRDIAQAVGRTPEFVQQHRRLVRLDPEYQRYVADGRLSMHEALRLLAGPSRGGEGGDAAPQAEGESDDATLPMFGNSAGQGAETPADPLAEISPEDARWLSGGFVLANELRASGAAIPGVCSRAPVARLYRQGDAFDARYRVRVTVDFGGGHIIESHPIPGAERADIAVACATDDILARWPAGRSIPPRPFIEWLDRMTGQQHVVAGRFCDNAEAAEARRIELGWVSRPTPPAPEPDPDARPDLKPRQRLILIELAHKIAAAPRPLDPTGEAEWSGDAQADYACFGTDCGSYWTDQGFQDLAMHRLVLARHQPGGSPPIAALTAKGVEWLAAEGVPLPPADFQVQDAQGAAGDAGKFHTPDRYTTAWLAAVARPPAAPEPGVGSDPAAPANDDPWDRSEEQIKADADLLDKVRDWTDGNDPLNDGSALVADLGVHEARVHADGWVELLAPDGAVVAEISVDQHSRLPDERVTALELLVAWAINTALEGF